MVLEIIDYELAPGYLIVRTVGLGHRRYDMAL